MGNSKIDTIIFLGKTGSGKGTQAKMLSEKLGYKMFSTGDRFREMRLNNNPLGRKVKESYDQGLLMPHWLASFVFQELILNLGDNEKVVFEGMGRTLSESENFDEVCEWLGRDYITFYLDVRDEIVIKRQQERQRDDLDKLDKIKRRLEEFRLHTSSAINYFRAKGKLIEINGEGAPEEVYQEIIGHLK